MINYEPNVYASPERAALINGWLEDFYKIFDLEVNELRFLLKRSWEQQIGQNTIELTPTAIYQPKKPAEQMRREIQLNRNLRIRTVSDKKWNICGGLAFYEGFEPIRDAPTEDEDRFHQLIRKWDSNFPKWYPVMVAKAKQSNKDVYNTAMITLDTVTFADGVPLEKPHDVNEAKKLIAQISGKAVTTDTGWVLGMPLQSGASIQLLNTTRISYTMKSISAEEINNYVETTTPEALTVPVGIDLSTIPARSRYIDTSAPVTFSAHDCFERAGHLTLPGSDMDVSVFNPIFAGVPINAIRALLPMLNEIYLHGDPFYNEEHSL